MDDSLILGTATYLGGYIVYSYNNIEIPGDAEEIQLSSAPVGLLRELSRYGRPVSIYRCGNEYYVVLEERSSKKHHVLKIVPMRDVGEKA